ncbi:MAG TPA: hypothetical protein DCW88_12530 [Agrobacterium sp.]|uniref:hypothetical protein n=1 Tax=Agrobacterium pusense TaxID=648995 RepID=UPI000E9D8CA9|nr:hypothetical protein [Agrobacterium sp.]
MTTATIQPAAWRVSMGTTADHNYWHYFGKKPKSIDDGEIWEPLYSASTLESLQRENETLRRAQSYTYIGRDGKAVLARDLEDRAEAAEAEVKLIREAVVELLDQAEHVCLGAHTPRDINEAARNLADPIAKVHTALSAQVQDVAGWQSMDSAPKDGKHCLIAVKTGPFVYAVQGAFLDGEWENVAGINSEPLCWMALTRIPPVYLPWTDEFAAAAPAKQEG